MWNKSKLNPATKQNYRGYPEKKGTAETQYSYFFQDTSNPQAKPTEESRLSDYKKGIKNLGSSCFM